MSLETLKILIDSACFSGKISDADRKNIESKASQSGVSVETVNKLIEEALAKHANNAEEMESGFITIDEQNDQEVIQTPPPPPPTNNVVHEKSKFTDVKPLITQGAMSVVSQAKLHGKWIIIKRIKPEYKDNPKYRELFMREFENAYHLDHPHIVRMLDKGEDDEGLYYTMEYVDGRPLSELITDKGIKNDNLSEKIIRQILDALSYVHKKQIFHRDLKPDNIYVTFRGDNVKVLDFGLAAADSFDDDLAKVGTPRYAAPEQMSKGYDVDQRADIYSLGKIFLELLTGSVKPEDVSKINKPSYKFIVSKSLKEIPNERFNNCEEIVYLLDHPNEIQEQKIEKTIPVKEPKTVKEPKPPKEKTNGKKSPLLFIILAVVVIGGLIATYFLVFANNGEGGNILNGNNKNNDLIAKADSLAKVGEFQEALNLYNSIEKKNDEINGKINTVNQSYLSLKEADSLYSEKYLVKAMKLYNDLKDQYPYSSKLNEKYEECLKIYQSSKLENFEPVQYTSSGNDSMNGLWGFKDNSNGYIVVDYQFNSIDSQYKWYKSYAKLIPVEKDGSWGFITSKKEVADFSYEKVSTALPYKGFSGVVARKNGKKYHIHGDENGVLIEVSYN